MGNAKIKAQVSVELTLSLILLAVLLFATAKVFVWLGRSILYRHISYENTRTAAGKPNDNDVYRITTEEGNQMVNFYDAKRPENQLKIVSE